MAARLPQGANQLKGFRPPGRFDKGLAAQLPAAYKKFWNEWRVQQPAPVHYIAKQGKWERNEVTGEVKPIQNIPIPMKFPKEFNYGIWGGEGVIKGFQKRSPTKRRVPHFWVPILKKSVVFSAVLDKYFSIVVTDRTLDLIHQNLGFDHYILKTPACDLKSTLALTMKRHILQELEKGCPILSDKPSRQTEILQEFGPYLNDYTPEEIEWYGFTFDSALDKLDKALREKQKSEIVPHKIIMRQKLIEQLKENQEIETEEAGNVDKSTSLLSKLNPFGKKET